MFLSEQHFADENDLERLMLHASEFCLKTFSNRCSVLNHGAVMNARVLGATQSATVILMDLLVCKGVCL